MKYKLEYVTDLPELWAMHDPVRPELDINFKTSPGRGVFGLLGEDGNWKAFMCYARTFLIPRNIKELEEFTNKDGNVIIPYTVWSHEKGAGRAIIDEVLQLAKDVMPGVDRIVTLSPQTTMARKFHLRNNAKQFRMNESTVNFEYAVIT
jgi:hypothetical protein